jgi:hypothetical protein
MATPCAAASSRNRSTVWSRSSTDGAFGAAAKPMLKLGFAFISPIGPPASRSAALIALEILSFAKTAPDSVDDIPCSRDSQERQETIASGSTAGPSAAWGHRTPTEEVELGLGR